LRGRKYATDVTTASGAARVLMDSRSAGSRTMGTSASRQLSRLLNDSNAILSNGVRWKEFSLSQVSFKEMKVLLSILPPYELRHSCDSDPPKWNCRTTDIKGHGEIQGISPSCNGVTYPKGPCTEDSTAYNLPAEQVTRNSLARKKQESLRAALASMPQASPK